MNGWEFCKLSIFIYNNIKGTHYSISSYFGHVEN